MTRQAMIVGLVAGAAALGTGPTALGQNALGGGDALDANLGTTSGGYNAAERRLDFRARNLLITGDVIGGRSFQDIVGYSAVDDFRGNIIDEGLTLLGIDTGGATSDALYSFRRDAASSDPVLMRLGSRYDRVRYGFEANEISLRRESWVATSGDLSRGGRQDTNPAKLADSRIVFDQLTLAQTLAAEAERSAEPQFVGRMQGDDTSIVISVSPLLGIVPMQDPDPSELSDLTRLSTFDLARLRQDKEEGRGIEKPGAKFRASFADLVEGQRLGGEAAEGRIDLTVSDDYTTILERVAQRYATRENVDLEVQRGLGADLDATMEQVRRGLAGEPPPAPTPPEPGAEEPEDEQDQQRTPLGRERPGAEREADEEREPGRTRQTTEGIGIVLRHGAQIDTLSSEDATRVNELIAAAEQRLRDGEYFWAERRFDRALRFVPGHPLATAGLGHSQIGAGLYLRAGLTLRAMLQRQPEMIDATYGEGLLPNRVALLSSIDEIRARISDETSAEDRTSYGFLMAYLGHMIGDRALIDEGLSIYEQAAPDDPLLALLRQVWIEGETPQK